MIDWDKPIRHKDGRKARLICKDRLSSIERDYAILVLDHRAVEDIYFLRSDGKFNAEDNYPVVENIPETVKLAICLDAFHIDKLVVFNSRDSKYLDYVKYCKGTGTFIKEIEVEISS